MVLYCVTRCLYKVLQGVTWYYISATRCCTVLHRVSLCYKVLHSFKGCDTLYTVLQCYRVLQSQHVTSCYTVLKGGTQCYMVLKGETQCYSSVTLCDTMLHGVK